MSHEHIYITIYKIINKDPLYSTGFPGSLANKNLPAVQETLV